MSEYYDLETGEPIDDYDLDQRYSDMLSEIYREVNICGMTYDAAYALKEVDPIAYRTGFSDWLDSEIGETITEEAPNTSEPDGGLS